MRVPTVALTLLLAACGSGDGEPAATGDEITTTSSTTTSSSTTTTSLPVPGLEGREGECSAAGLGAGVANPADLPAPVIERRTEIIDAAVACDYERLRDLATEGEGTFSYSFGGGETDQAADHWRQLEEEGEEVLRLLVETLQLPSVTDDDLVIWPSAHQESPGEEDWEALRGLYDDEQIDSWRSGGTGFLGYRVGITEDGDWRYFIAGD